MTDTERAEFKHDMGVTIETIGAVIDAYGAGEIQLEAVPKDTNKIHIHALAPARAYTCMTVAKFLGWLYKNKETGEIQPTRTCRIAFDAWHAQQQTGVDVAAYIVSANISRRHLSKGQRAMALAKLYPDAEKGGRGKTRNAITNIEFASQQYVSHARTVLHWLPVVAEQGARR